MESDNKEKKIISWYPGRPEHAQVENFVTWHYFSHRKHLEIFIFQLFTANVNV